MQVLFQCPLCQATRAAAVELETRNVSCTDCGWTRPVPVDVVSAVGPKTCLICGCGDLWRQKDFPQKLGLAMVALGALLSTIAFSLYMPTWALGILLAFALADMVLFVVMKDVLVCYRCHARYKHADWREDHPRFNLETAERYRQEAARLEEFRNPVHRSPS